jgi:hypothetical protein
MKLLNVVQARSVWLFSTDDLNPRGLDLVPIVMGIRDRYSFQKHPTKAEEVYPASGGIEFGRGAFKLPTGDQIEVVSLVFFSDGIVAETRHSTTASDQVLEDVLSFATDTFRLSFDPTMVARKTYSSELVFATDIHLDRVNARLKRFAALLAKTAGEAFHFELGSLRFLSAPVSNGIQLQFTFERRFGTEFDQNRYYSQAPFTTEKHLELLQELEELLR